MYSEEIITRFRGRIGWDAPQEIGFGITISESNLASESGRVMSAFHALATVENLYAAIPNATETAEKFNTILSDILKEAVLSIVPLILDKNKKYDPVTNYDQLIIDNITLFDDAIGYKAAIIVLEKFMSSKRSNLSERNAKLSIANLKLELNGIRSESTGRMVAYGTVHSLQNAIKSATSKLFPVTATVDSKSIW